jgi:hypothetical protein
MHKSINTGYDKGNDILFSDYIYKKELSPTVNIEDITEYEKLKILECDNVLNKTFRTSYVKFSDKIVLYATEVLDECEKTLLEPYCRCNTCKNKLTILCFGSQCQCCNGCIASDLPSQKVISATREYYAKHIVKMYM